MPECTQIKRLHKVLSKISPNFFKLPHKVLTKNHKHVRRWKVSEKIFDHAIYERLDSWKRLEDEIQTVVHF